MKIDESLQDLFAPPFDDFELDVPDTLHILPQGASADELCDEDHLVLRFVDPG